MKSRAWLRALLSCALFIGCGGSEEARPTETAAATADRSRSISGGEQPADDRARCDAAAANREVSEYDTSGDDQPDVRKVFLVVGTPPRAILICRESDLNSDGTKDVVRYYNDEGRPLREEADRNFDQQMDEVTYFEEGQVVRQEIDGTGDGVMDTKLFFENGRPLRAERDLTGRSTANEWRPDRWEYYEGGRLIRMGTDLNGDARVDRWDRDDELRDQLQAEADSRAGESAGASGSGEGSSSPDDLGSTGSSPTDSSTAPAAAPTTTPAAPAEGATQTTKNRRRSGTARSGTSGSAEPAP